MQRARFRIVSIVAFVALGGVVAVAACSNMGEGEPCDSLNNNDDCQDPLQCTPKALINSGYNKSDRCCPVDRSTATTPACIVVQGADAGNTTPPPDTGPTPDATTDSPVETGTPVEAGSDADADAGDANEGG